MLTTITSTRRAPSLLLAVSAFALLLGVTGCSAATTGGPASTSAPADAGTTQSEFDASYHKYELTLAQCLRDQGVDIADPAADGYLVLDDPSFREPLTTCRADVGDPPIREYSLADREAQLKIGLEWAKCLREKGYDIAEPTLETPIFGPAEVPSDDYIACQPAASLDESGQ